MASEKQTSCTSSRHIFSTPRQSIVDINSVNVYLQLLGFSVVIVLTHELKGAYLNRQPRKSSAYRAAAELQDGASNIWSAWR